MPRRSASCWGGRSASSSARGRSSPRAGSATCCPSSSSLPARPCWTCPRRWRRGSGSWARAAVDEERPQRRASVAVAALRTAGLRQVAPVGHAEVLRLLAKRNTDIGDHRTRVVCRMHALLAELAAGGIAKEINASDVDAFLADITPATRSSRSATTWPSSCSTTSDASTPSSRTPTADPTSGRSIGHDGHRPLRHRPDPRRDAHRLHRRHHPVRGPRPLRRLQRHRPRRVLLRRTRRAPRVPTREPPAQPRPAHGRDLPAPPTPQRRTRLLRPQASPRARPDETPSGRSSGTSPTPSTASSSPTPAPRRCSGPGRTTGNDSKACAAGLTSLQPALRRGHFPDPTTTLSTTATRRPADAPDNPPNHPLDTKRIR